MARILLVTGMLANIPYYHQAWLFEPLSFLLCWTAVTTMKMASPLLRPDVKLGEDAN
jgi:hypothetical protein